MVKWHFHMHHPSVIFQDYCISHELSIQSCLSLEHIYLSPHNVLNSYIQRSYFGTIQFYHDFFHLGVSKNNGTPKSSILIGFSIIFTIHFGVPLFLETSILLYFSLFHFNPLFCDQSPARWSPRIRGIPPFRALNSGLGWASKNQF